MGKKRDTRKILDKCCDVENEETKNAFHLFTPRYCYKVDFLESINYSLSID